MINKICNYCGVKYYIKNSRENSKYCSAKCKNSDYRQIIASGNCLQCNNYFKYFSGENNFKYRKFCSRSCASKYNANIFMKKEGFGWKTYYNWKKTFISRRKNIRCFPKIDIINKTKGTYINMKKHIVLECEECKKLFVCYVNDLNMFCCRSCAHKYMKRNNISCFYNREMQAAGGRAVIDKLIADNIKYNRGYNNKKWQSIGGKLGMKVLKNKYGINFFIKAGKAAAASNKLNHTGMFHDQNIAMRGRIEAQKTLNNKKRIIFNGIYFASYKECELAMCIHHQLEEIEKGKNYQFLINYNYIDFFIKKYNCFIEYHPILNFYKINKDIDYYNYRRKLLDLNGYKDYNLVVIK